MPVMWGAANEVPPLLPNAGFPGLDNIVVVMVAPGAKISVLSLRFEKQAIVEGVADCEMHA